MQKFGSLSVTGQLGAVSERVNDPRGSFKSGYDQLDSLLYRGGFQPGLFCILGGRTHTRKTTLTANLISRMLDHGRKVGFISLDETPAQYTLKIMSAMFGVPHADIEEGWNTKPVQNMQAEYLDKAKHLSLTKGYRPNIEALDAWLSECEVHGGKPEVVFHDYGSLMARANIYGGETQRILQMMEDLQVWTKKNQLVTIMLHQLNRDGGDDGSTPVTLADLKYGGEEMADIVLATYRPALDELGNLEFDDARAASKKDLTEEDWEWHRDRVRRYQNSTMVQLIKNRPGTHLDKKGIELLSYGESMLMRQPDERDD